MALGFARLGGVGLGSVGLVCRATQETLLQEFAGVVRLRVCACKNPLGHFV